MSQDLFIYRIECLIMFTLTIAEKREPQCLCNNLSQLSHMMTEMIGENVGLMVSKLLYVWAEMLLAK